MLLSDTPGAILSQAALESMHEGLITVDAQGTIHLFNEAAGRMLGVAAADAVGETFAAVLLELPRADALTEVVFDAIQRGQFKADQEIEIEAASGTRTLHVTTAFLRDSSGQAPAGVVITLHDITELKALAAQLQQAYQSVDDKNQRLTELLRRIQLLRIAAVVVVLSLVAGLAWFSSSLNLQSSASPADAAPAPGAGVDLVTPSRTVTVGRGTITRTLRMAGFLEPVSRITVVSQLGGRVVNRPVRLGQIVSKGDVIFEIRDETLDSRIRTGEVAVLRARQKVLDLSTWETSPDVQESRRNLTLAEMAANEQKKALDEAERLFAKDIISEQEVTAARSSLQRADLAVQTARQSHDQTLRRASKEAVAEASADLANAEDALRAMKAQEAQQVVRAPSSGYLVTPPSMPGGSAPALPNAGDNVSPGTPLAAVADVSGFAVAIKVDELEIQRIEPGQPATVTMEALGGTTLDARVDSVGGQAVIENNAPQFEVRISILQVPPDARKMLRLGLSAEVEVTTARREQALVLPLEAIGGMSGDKYVWIQDARAPGGRRKQTVTVGLADFAQAEITGGVKEGEVVLY